MVAFYGFFMACAFIFMAQSRVYVFTATCKGRRGISLSLSPPLSLLAGTVRDFYFNAVHTDTHRGYKCYNNIFSTDKANRRCSFRLSLSLSVGLSICLPVCLSVRLPVCLSFCLYVSLSLSICLSACLSFCSSVSFSFLPSAFDIC